METVRSAGLQDVDHPGHRVSDVFELVPSVAHMNLQGL